MILNSHPVVDRSRYKADLASRLLDRGDEVVVLFGGARLRDYAREARRRNLADVRRNRGGHAPPGAGSTLRSIAKERHLCTLTVGTLGDRDALAFVRDQRPDLVVNLSALFIPSRFLETADAIVVGAHYAELPRVRGGDSIRWSILLDIPLAVSYQVLTADLDMGDIVRVDEVGVEIGDDVATLRSKCKETSVTGYQAIADDVRFGRLSRRRQSRSDGSTFFRMGSLLRNRVDELLDAHRYSHYTSITREP
jgi:methionyl-tRNA formyltransferase